MQTSIPRKGIIGLLVTGFVLLCEAFGVNVHDLAPSLTVAISNLVNAVVALVPLAFAVWGHIQVVQKHADLIDSTKAQTTPSGASASTPPSVAPKRSVLLPLLAVLFLGAMSQTACVSTAGGAGIGTAPTGSAIIESALPLIRTGAAVATGAVLDFAVQQPATRTRLANEMYSAASAVYSLSGGTFPTPAQFAATVTSFGGSDADASYAQFTSGISSLYATYFPKLSTGDAKTATDLLNAMAGGIEDATQSYVTVAPNTKS